MSYALVLEIFSVAHICSHCILEFFRHFARLTHTFSRRQSCRSCAGCGSGRDVRGEERAVRHDVRGQRVRLHDADDRAGGVEAASLRFVCGIAATAGGGIRPYSNLDLLVYCRVCCVVQSAST